MTYIDRAGLEARFDEVGDLAPEPGEGQADAKMDAAIADAAAVIDERLAAAYVLPLPAGSYPTLTRIAADLARLRLHDETSPDHVVARAKTSHADLDAIVSGTLELVDAAGVAAPRRAEARFQSRDQEFRRSDEATGRLSGLDNF
ncbi:MAG: DUF1320 domain-containing protein [Alphaproteobacteria bacterium]|nr:DUF1320 domain-containing protein [Alphaproteobacteria bacterium]